MNSLLLFLKFHIVWWSSKDGALYRFLRAVHAKHEEEKEIKLWWRQHGSFDLSCRL